LSGLALDTGELDQTDGTQNDCHEDEKRAR